MDREELYWRMVLQRVATGPVNAPTVAACWQLSGELLALTAQAQDAEAKAMATLKAKGPGKDAPKK